MKEEKQPGHKQKASVGQQQQHQQSECYGRYSRLQSQVRGEQKLVRLLRRVSTFFPRPALVRVVVVTT